MCPPTKKKKNSQRKFCEKRSMGRNRGVTCFTKLLQSVKLKNSMTWKEKKRELAVRSIEHKSRTLKQILINLFCCCCYYKENITNHWGMWVYPCKLLEKLAKYMGKKSSLLLTLHQNKFYIDMLTVNNEII